MGVKPNLCTDSLGCNVRTLREGAGLSRAELATLAGIGRMTIWRVETRNVAQMETLVAIARALEVSVDALLARRRSAVRSRRTA